MAKKIFYNEMMNSINSNRSQREILSQAKSNMRREDNKRIYSNLKKEFTPRKATKSERQMPSYLRGKELKLSKAVSGFAAAFLPQGSVPSGKGIPSGRGRGRPVGTVKYSIQGRPVDVFTWRKYVAAMKKQAALQSAMQQVRQAGASQGYATNMQPSAQEMPQGYGQYDSEDAFLDQPDMSMQTPQFQSQTYPQSQGYPQKAIQGYSRQNSRFGDFMSRLTNWQGQEQQAPPMSAGLGPSRRMRLWGDGVGLKSTNNILNTQNIFNNPTREGRLPLV